MPAYPGPLGLAAFGGIKFTGYTLAGKVLRVYPATTASALKIGAVRTGLGILIGISHFALSMAFFYNPRVNADPSPLPFLVRMFVLSFVIWMGIIRFFCGEPWLSARTLSYALAGTILSFVLDGLGIALALITPGQVPVC